MPVDQRSAEPSIPGIPAWGAVAVAVGAAFLGVVLDAFRGTELTNTFAVLYVLGCLIAVLAVRNRGVFTAIAQAPLIIFFGVPVAYQFLSEGGGSTTIKDFVLNAAVPLVNRFPLMLFTTLVILVIGVGRVVFARGTGRAPKPRSARTTPARERAAKAPRARAGAPAGRGDDLRDRPTAPRRDTAPPPGVADPRSDRSRAAEPRTAQPRTTQPRTAEPTVRAGDPLRQASYRSPSTPRRRPAVRQRPPSADRSTGSPRATGNRVAASIACRRAGVTRTRRPPGGAA